MLNGGFDSQHCRQLYRDQVCPTLQNHEPHISLDERNEFYLSLINQQSLLQPGKHLLGFARHRTKTLTHWMSRAFKGQGTLGEKSEVDTVRFGVVLRSGPNAAQSVEHALVC